MSQDVAGDNSGSQDPSPDAPGGRPAASSWVAWFLAWVVVGGLWLGTLAAVVRSEILQHRESADVRSLVDSARLARTHASALYAIRLGSATVGSLESTVSGGQHDEQLAYVIEGQLTVPQPIHLKGVVLAGWDRRPQRLVLEVTVGADRHRLDGTLQPDAASGGSLFELRYTPPATSGLDARAFNWVLPEAPLLAPGPLPIPEFSSLARSNATEAGGESLSASVPREGALPDPMTGAPMAWSISSTRVETLVIAGRAREARRHDLKVGAWEGRAWTEASGFPLRLELPGGVIVELIEEKR